MKMRMKYLIAGLCIAGLLTVGACGNKKAEEAKAAAAAATAAAQEAQAAAAAAQQAQEAASAEWATLSADLPKMVSAIQSRVDILSKSKKLPANVSKESFDSARAGLDMINSTWADANAAATSGNSVDAVAKARQVQEKGAEVLALLGMSGG
jgi:tRNA U34 5-carboxymethylaminomethyl modifying GTPase MnmE/TrmE